jgi:hypothetical protein
VRVVAERVAARAPADAPGYDCALAMEAFGCAETGDGERAQALAQRALEIAPASPYALHALAHALVTQRRGADARALLESTAPAWRRRGRMASHNAWHLALLRLESGDREAALAAVERELVPAAAAEPGAVADATDLLWRLELRGADTARAWRRLAASWAERHVAGFWGFLDVLAGVAFERAGDVRRARSLARNVARAAAAARSPEERAAQLTTGDALAALAAYTVEDFGRASALLREVLPRLGGSVPQRELLGLTLAAAERRHAEIALDAAVAA